MYCDYDAPTFVLRASFYDGHEPGQYGYVATYNTVAECVEHAKSLREARDWYVWNVDDARVEDAPA